MENKMFCYQCQETAGNKGCTQVGVCGKNSTTANLQDLLIDITKGLSSVLVQARKENIDISRETNQCISFNLFITITNANFDDEMIIRQIHKTIDIKNTYLHQLTNHSSLPQSALYNINDIEQRLTQVSILSENDEDIRSLKELITYALKGMGAYNKHANALNYYNEEIDIFMQDTLDYLQKDLSLNELISLVMKTGEYGVKVMALLDEANTSTYGHPEITEVNIGVRNNPGILVSGHDLKDLEILLEQTQGTGIDVYTHGEMLPAHYYPFFKKYDHFVGNYGNAWWKQKEEFEAFNGPILLTTNCLVPPKSSYKDRIYTTGAVGFDGCTHIEINEDGTKDFSQIIEHAKKCKAPTEIESGHIIGGFAHEQVFSLANQVVEAVKSGAIKKFVVMAGCDGRMKSRQYYEDFAKALPQDTVILTAGCAKYKYNKLNLGDINGIPRVLDAGQCNDSYSLALIALKLKEVFELEDINELPIIYNIAWYEQKAVIVLLALLSLGVKNIHLGPTLPAFLSPNVVSFLVDNFNIAGIQDVESDIKTFFPKSSQSQYTKNMIVADILHSHPHATQILTEEGFGCLGCPASQTETLEDACFVHGANIDNILNKLNKGE